MTKLEMHRRAKGKTLKDIADFCEVKPESVWEWMNGHSHPSAPNTPKLAKALGLKPMDLMQILAEQDVVSVN